MKIRSERHLEVKHGGRVRNADPYGEIWIDPLGIVLKSMKNFEFCRCTQFICHCSRKSSHCLNAGATMGDPLSLLMNYVKENSLRLKDVFAQFNKSGTLRLSHQEFVRGMQVYLASLHSCGLQKLPFNFKVHLFAL